MIRWVLNGSSTGVYSWIVRFHHRTGATATIFQPLYKLSFSQSCGLQSEPQNVLFVSLSVKPASINIPPESFTLAVRRRCRGIGAHWQPAQSIVRGIVEDERNNKKMISNYERLLPAQRLRTRICYNQTHSYNYTHSGLQVQWLPQIQRRHQQTLNSFSNQ